MKQSDDRNLSMVMDFYEMTMANGYFKYRNTETKVAFDVFYRKNPEGGGFSIFCGLTEIIQYIQDLHFDTEDIDYFRSLNIFPEEFLNYLADFRFKGDIYSLPEGTIMYPNTPILTVVAPLIDAQLIETAILLQVNHQSLIATKARRIVKAANGKIVSDFGARRAHNVDSAVYGAKACYVGGCASTATVLAGQRFNIPISGTMAHSWVMFFPDEYTAFKNYAETYPDNCMLLVDTYDVLESGVPNAIKVAKEVLEPMGKRLKGIRLDSGDLAYLSKEARKMLDKADCKDCIIIASNSLDEYTIESLNQQGACIDSYGVGERMITAKTEPVFGAVYKIVAVYENNQWIPKIKVSENVEKITNPGLKKLYRIFDEKGYAISDLLTLTDETMDWEYDEKKQIYHINTPYRYVDPTKPWKVRNYENCTAKELQVKIFEDGKLIYNSPNLKEVREYVKTQLDTSVWEEEQRFSYPHTHYVDMSPTLYQLKMDLLHKARKIDD